MNFPQEYAHEIRRRYDEFVESHLFALVERSPIVFFEIMDGRRGRAVLDAPGWVDWSWWQLDGETQATSACRLHGLVPQMFWFDGHLHPWELVK